VNVSPVAAFEHARDDFAEAQARTGRLDHFYRLGPFVVRLSFAGPALVPLLTAALAHRAVAAPARADLTICVWSGANSGERPPCNGIEGDARRPVRQDTVVLATRDGGARLWGLDGSRDVALYRVAGADSIPSYETAAPFLDILHWWMRERGIHLVHAAAVGTAAGGALLVGKGGSGKSTAALACIGRRLRHAADDHCLVSLGPPPALWSLYNSAKVEAARLADFEHLHTAPAGRHEGKAVLHLYPREQEALIEHFPLRAICAVCISGRRETMLRPAPPAAILQALAPSTVLQIRGADQRDMRFLAQISRALPGYVLEVGTELTLIEPAIVEVLAAG
jgi:hypothetical protein